MNFRFVVLSAVSTQDQATEDKDSLDHQYKTARTYGERMGGTFLREYRAEGFSRTGYFDLTQALNNNKDFNDLAQDARSHKFDVILLESYDRLGDLGFMWFNYLAFVGRPYIQLRSVQQALPIEDPSIYDPRRDDSTPAMINQSLTINKYRINKIIRAFEIGNPKRARDGKFSIHVPYGYIKIDKDTVVVNENVAPLLKSFVHWYLEGKPMGEIVRCANESNIPPRDVEKWSHNIIMYVLKNPFYAGKTFHGRGWYDKKGYHLKENYNDLYDGKHEALWSWETYLQLQEEIARRRHARHEHTDYNLTGLLKCSVCGETLHISYSSQYPNRKFWYCDQKHVRILKEDAERLVADELVRLFSGMEYDQHQAQSDAHDHTEKKIKGVERQIARLDEAYKFGSHTPQAYADERQKLLSQLESLKDKEKQKETEQRRMNEREQVVITMRELIGSMHEWVTTQNPQTVKFHLSRVVELTAHPDKTIRGKLL